MDITELSKEELENNYKQFLTVGELKEFLYKNNLPNDAKVMIQRVKDVYYERHNWKVYLKEGEHTLYDKEGKVDKDSLEQYSPAWCCVKYNDEQKNLFIDLHY